jgi:uncharacterized membrane protein YhaH (DUF805 family)
MNHFTAALKKYAVFTGRSSRSEYWYFILFCLLISVMISFVEGFFQGLFGVSSSETQFPILGPAFQLAMLIPSISISVRRLHDISKSGWWLLLDLIPIVGWIIIFCFSVMDSTQGDNIYGPNPKSINPSQGSGSGQPTTV